MLDPFFGLHKSARYQRNTALHFTSLHFLGARNIRGLLTYATKRERMHSTSGNAKRSIWPALRFVAVAPAVTDEVGNAAQPSWRP